MIENLRTMREGETRTGFFSFKDRLCASESEEVTTATVVEQTTADLTIVVVEAEDDKVTFTVAGGNSGTQYTLKCEAVTSEGQYLIRLKTFNVI